MADTIYFEKQVSLYCAQHSLNMLLQGPVFSLDYLQEIARELDNHERALLSPGGEANFRSENADHTGYFSIQVIQMALQKRSSVRLIPFDSPNAESFRKEPAAAKAYLINRAKHWFSARKFGSKHWFLLNSVNEGPRPMSASYLENYLIQLGSEGVSIFVVVGVLPDSYADSVLSLFQELPISAPTNSGRTLEVPELESVTEDAFAMAVKNSLSEEAAREEKTRQEEAAIFMALEISQSPPEQPHQQSIMEQIGSVDL